MKQSEIKNSPKYQSKLQRAFRLYEKGKSVREINKTLHVKRSNITEYLRSHGVEVKIGVHRKTASSVV